MGIGKNSLIATPLILKNWYSRISAASWLSLSHLVRVNVLAALALFFPPINEMVR